MEPLAATFINGPDEASAAASKGTAMRVFAVVGLSLAAVCPPSTNAWLVLATPAPTLTPI